MSVFRSRRHSDSLCAGTETQVFDFMQHFTIVHPEFSRRFGAGDFPPSSITFCNSDSRIMIRPPTLVRCNLPWLSQA